MLFRRCTTDLASSSISISGIWSWMHRERPSLIAQSLACKLFAHPIALQNPLIHLPWWFLRSPPPPARPGQPKTEITIVIRSTFHYFFWNSFALGVLRFATHSYSFFFGIGVTHGYSFLFGFRFFILCVNKTKPWKLEK